MIRKLAIYMVFLTTLNGCAQGLAFLGPVFSYSQSGSVTQSALSYGSNQLFKKIKKNESNTSDKNKGNAFDDNGTFSEDHLSLRLKNKIENASSIKNLANQ